MRFFCTAIFAAFSLLLSGCTELTVLRERVEIQDKEIKRLQKENGEFQNAYYKISGDRTSDLTGLQERVDALTRELQEARNVKTDKEKQLEEGLHKQSLTTDATREDLGTKLGAANETIKQMTDSAAAADAKRVQMQAQL